MGFAQFDAVYLTGNFLMQYDLSHRYSDNIHHTRIAMLGISPPPLGGVSVHIERVMHKLQSQNNTVYFFNTEVRYRYKLFPFYLIKLILWFCWRRPKVVFYHSVYLDNSISELLILACLKRLFNYQLVLIEHDCRHMYKRTERFKKPFNLVLANTDQVVLIGNRTLQSYQDNKIKLTNCAIEGAFLPPDISREQEILATYPRTLLQFLAHHEPVILTNAFQLVLLDGKDLYGIDQSLLLLAQLKKEFPQVGLVIALAQIGDSNYFAQLQEQMQKLQVTNHVYIVHGQKVLWPLFKRVNLFVRPSLSDGASVSVQEALHFGCPVVASDVCARPDGATLFATGSHDDFCQKVSEVLRKNIYAEANKQRDYLHTQ